MVGFGHSRAAREEIARIKRRKGLQIVYYDAKELLISGRRERIVKELVPPGEQLSMDAVLMGLIPKERPTAEELIASELHARATEVAQAQDKKVG
jgi:hypothetical protein